MTKFNKGASLESKQRGQERLEFEKIRKEQWREEGARDGVRKVQGIA